MGGRGHRPPGWEPHQREGPGYICVKGVKQTKAACGKIRLFVWENTERQIYKERKGRLSRNIGVKESKLSKERFPSKSLLFSKSLV